MIGNELLFLMQVVVVIAACKFCQQVGSCALTSWLSIQVVLANLLVLKMVNLFGLEVTVSDVYSIGSLYCLNVLRETHGRLRAKYAVLTSFVLVFVVVGMFCLHLAFVPSGDGKESILYQELLGQVWPIMLISNLIFVLVQLFDYVVFGFLQSRYGHYRFAFRLMMSIGLTQILDTALFTYWALSDLGVNFWNVFIWSYGLKMLITLMISVGSGLAWRQLTGMKRWVEYVQV